MRVIELAHLDKLLTINEQTGPADLVDVDVFSDTGANDKKIVENIYQNDDDLIAQELADLGGDETASSVITDAPNPSDGNTKENNQNTDPEAASDTEKTENSGLFKPGTF